MSLKKFQPGQSLALPGLRLATVVLSWDGSGDCDVVLGTAANNALSETVYFNHPTSRTGAIRLRKDAPNGFGLAKADESADIDFTLLPLTVTEVPVGVIVQGDLVFSQVQNVSLSVVDGATRTPLGAIDIDATFASVPAGKVGEFKRDAVTGQWRFAWELRAYHDIDVLAQNLAL